MEVFLGGCSYLFAGFVIELAQFIALLAVQLSSQKAQLSGPHTDIKF